MFRLLILTFFGKARYSHHDVHVHESPKSMLVPLVILAFFSIVAGYIGIPAVLGGHNQIEAFLSGAPHEAEHGSAAVELLLMAASTVVSLAGLGLAYLFYAARPELPEALSAKAHTLYNLLLNKYYVDEAYNAILVMPVLRSSREFLWKFMDSFVIDGFVNGIAYLVRGTAGGLRYMQSGYVRTYVGWIVLGGIIVMAWFLR
jgi:NADH-quinone oxidoreductase subunit L